MPSTFSPSLKIELPSTGTQSGIWGLTTNNNLGTLIEQAVTGVQSIVMADANYTLTNYNGVSDEARNAILVVTGTNAAVRDIVAPLVNKIYTIKNSTTGGFGIRIKGASGTAVTIPNTFTTTVYCDGINFYQSLSAVTGDFGIVGNASVGGSLGVTGVLSGTTASFSGAISSVSPTFTGVPTAPTASPGTNTTQLATTAFVNTATSGLGTMSTQNANNVAITGGTINGVSGTNASLSVGTATNATNVVSSGTIASTVTGTTQALGTNNTTIATTAFALANGVPSGSILLWSGSIASIPSGWLLCNGASGTPDLRSRFVVGAGSTYAVAATGGSADAVVVSHTHTASSVVADPGHVHYTYGAYGGGGNPGGSLNVNNPGGQNEAVTTATTGISVATTNTATGVSGTNANLPPYYALAYIMKA